MVQLEEAAYTVNEGASLEVCAVIIGDSDSTVTADLLATEGSALGIYIYERVVYNDRSIIPSPSHKYKLGFS